MINGPTIYLHFMNSDVYSLLIHADSAIDNPTYDECQGTSMTNNLTANHELERDFENPIYGDDTEMGINSTSKAELPIQSTSLYEGIYSESTEVNETLHESADNGVQGAYINGASNKSGVQVKDGAKMYEATPDPEGVYEQPPDSDNDIDENCYSTLDPTYSQFQPHIPKPMQIQYPLNDDEYSCLQYK